MTSLLPPHLRSQNNGIASLLNPLLSHVNQQYQDNVIDPYVQQVEQLTTETFPNVQFNNTSLGRQSPLLGGSFQNSYSPGGGMFLPSFNPMRSPSAGTGSVLQARIQAMMGGGLGSFGLGPLRGSM